MKFISEIRTIFKIWAWVILVFYHFEQIGLLLRRKNEIKLKIFISALIYFSAAIFIVIIKVEMHFCFIMGNSNIVSTFSFHKFSFSSSSLFSSKTKLNRWIFLLNSYFIWTFLSLFILVRPSVRKLLFVDLIVANISLHCVTKLKCFHFLFQMFLNFDSIGFRVNILGKHFFR